MFLLTDRFEFYLLSSCINFFKIDYCFEIYGDLNKVELFLSVNSKLNSYSSYSHYFYILILLL
jgi:hypothetical protein